MDRKQFLGNLFCVAMLYSMPKLLKETAEKIMPAVPGVSGQRFKILLHKAWFHTGDILNIGSQENQFYCTMTKDNQMMLTEITDNPNKVIFDIELMVDGDIRANDIENRVRKVCSAVPMEDCMEDS